MGVEHAGLCECQHCQPQAPLWWEVELVVADDLRRTKAAEDELDPFQEVEAAVATLLASEFNGSAADAYALITAAIGPTPVDLRVVEQALDESSALVATVISAAALVTLHELISNAFADGAADATGGAPPESRVRLRTPLPPTAPVFAAPMVARVIDHTAESVRFYANKFYGEVLLPTIRARLSDAIANANAIDPLAPEVVTTAVARAFNQHGYWRMVANAAVSRAYHYGLLKTAALAGRRSYAWHAVVDKRTSEVCLTMNGLQFWVADAVNLLEGVAATDDPEAATKLMPWRGASEIQGASAADLRHEGLLVPPAHPHCRSTLVLL